MSKLTETIEQAYGLDIIDLVTIKRLKQANYVGKINTSDGKMYVVKSLNIHKSRQQFIVETEQLLRERGVKLASPMISLENQLFFQYKGSIYVIYEWIKGEKQRLANRKDLQSIVQVLGQFHRSSVGLIYSQGTKIYSHKNWVKDYNQRLETMSRWKKKYKKSKDPKNQVILKNIPFFYNIGKKALKKLKSSPYQAMISESYRKQSLVHGDFHQNNMLIQGNQKVLIDFEDVRYDLPSKDLLRIFEMYLRKHKFNEKVFRGMFRKYEATNPLSNEVKEVVLIDFLFPHIFERNLRQNKYVQTPLSKAIHQIKQERKKIKFIYKYYFGNK